MWDLWGATGSEVILDERQIGSLRRGKGYSRWALTSAKGWQLKHPKEKQDCSRWTPTSLKGWNSRGERNKIRILEYKVHRTACTCAVTTPTVSVFDVQAKIQKFYANMGTFDTPTCSTCPEKFPDLHCQPKSIDRLCCNHEKYAPKLYSSANNCRLVS